MITTKEPASSPMEAEFAPLHHYAVAWAAAERGLQAFAEAGRCLMQANITFALQQAELMRGMSRAYAQALPTLAQPRGVDDLLDATLRVAQAFDSDPRWTARPN